MTLVEKRDNLIREAKAIAEGAKAAGRGLTAKEMDLIRSKMDQVGQLNAQILEEDNGRQLFDQVMSLPSKALELRKDNLPARTLGEHFVRSVSRDDLVRFRSVPGMTLSAPEFKAQAATDTHVTGGPTGPYGIVLDQVDTSVVQANRPPVVVADLLSSGTLSGQSITYFVEGARAGNFATVAEGGHKPQMNYVYSTVTEALTKIAGFIKLSDEMIDDLAFLVSEINTRLLYDLAIFEEQQLLNGDGTAPNLRGILNRSGILTRGALDTSGNTDAIYYAITAVQIATGKAPDGLVINPADYENLRMAKDGNGQYMAGGPWLGAYGQGSGTNAAAQPNIWGLRTVVTTAIAAGTALVGAFKQCGTVYRRGGVSVSSTNSNVDDFENNLVTTRAEERLALAVRQPAGFCKITFSATPPA
jgi:HK97 family phage major capsid protein